MYPPRLPPRLYSGLAPQSKAFLLANPKLAKKLEAAVVEKLEAGDSHITAEAGGDVPADPPSLTASSETPERMAGSPDGTTGVSVEERDEVMPREEEDVLLEPGVGSVEELFESDVFSQVPVSGGGEAVSSEAGIAETSAGAEKEQLRS